MGITNEQIREFQEWVNENMPEFAATFNSLPKSDKKKRMDEFAERVEAIKSLNDTIPDKEADN